MIMTIINVSGHMTYARINYYNYFFCVRLRLFILKSHMINILWRGSYNRARVYDRVYIMRVRIYGF